MFLINSMYSTYRHILIICQSSWHQKEHFPVKLLQPVPILHLPQYKEQSAPKSPFAHTIFLKNNTIKDKFCPAALINRRV